MVIPFRSYDPQKDKEAAHRIWLEIGWLEKGKEEAMDLFVECGRALVADIHGQPECLVCTAPGAMRYLDQDVPTSFLTAVTTSRIARKQGFASRLTAQAVAADAAEGALVSALGMFEQGYYNQLGFGTGGYEHWVSFDPASLTVGRKARVPRRITSDDWAPAHACRLARRRGHGSCNIAPPQITRADMLWATNGFGLGYGVGPDGGLTHMLWCSVKEIEQGPYSVQWLAYQTADQFLELMALLRSLGDQVRLVRMQEPQGIQLQDILKQPFKQRQVSEKSKYESTIKAAAYWQMRICDLAGCLGRTHLWAGEVRFNLKLSDPIEGFLEADSPWRGISGEYVVTLGRESSAERGSDARLPTLTASVGAFTRLWLGVRPASGLAVTDDLVGPPDLLARLDRILCLPEPKTEWDF